MTIGIARFSSFVVLGFGSTLGCTKLEGADDSFVARSSVGANAGDRPGGAGGNAGGGVSGRSANGSAGSTSDAGGAVDDCVDRSGFQGLGCYRCAATDIVTLENACTNATCTPFDDSARLTRLGSDGMLPDLPVAPAGAGGSGGASPASGAGGSAARAGAASSGGSAGRAGAASSGGNAGSSGSMALGAVAGAGGAAGATTGGSTFNCSELESSNTVVYVTGSSAAKPFLAQIAQQLSGLGVYIVYMSTGSCVGVDAILNGTPLTTGPAPAAAAAATYWDSASSSGKACALPPPGVSADLGVSDVFAESCAGFELANLDARSVRDAHGPIQTMTFVVPASSTQAEISAQAAYFVFGFGAGSGVLDAKSGAPVWNREELIFQRSATSGTQAMIAAAIGVPAERWLGKPHQTSDDLAADLQAAGTGTDSARNAIGILAADYIDSKNLRAQLRVLAYADTHQKCAVYPDSTSTARDKRNVRDGHYPIWGPLHLFYRADAAGNPSNIKNRPAITNIIGYLSGSKALPNEVKLLDVYAQSGLIPECAMRVTRSKDGGNILPYAPSSPCSCLFDSKATGATDCKTCTVQGDCVAGETCSQGYCEK